MSKALLRVVRVIECVGAGMVLVVLAGSAGLCMTGRVAIDRAADAWQVLTGRRLAVSEADHSRWQKLEKDALARGEIRQQEALGCGEARDGFRRERAYRERQFEREAAILEAISRKVAENRASLATRTEDFERRHAAFRRRVEKERALKNDASFKKSLQLYQRMDPELVARDFEQKWAAGDEERRAVVETLRELPSRLSAEIIDAMTSSETRVAIMKEIRRGQSRPSSSGRS